MENRNENRDKIFNDPVFVHLMNGHLCWKVLEDIVDKFHSTELLACIIIHLEKINFMGITLLDEFADKFGGIMSVVWLMEDYPECRTFHALDLV